MHITDGKVGARELLGTVVFMIAMKATDSTPDLLIYHAMNASWLLSLLSGLIILLPLLLLVGLMKKYNTGLHDLLLRFTGRWVSGAIVALMFIGLFISTTINARSYVDIVNTLFFPQTSIPLILLSLLLFCSFVANRGFETIGRVTWLMFGVIMIVGTLLILTTWQHTSFSYLFPLLGPGLDQLLWDSLTHSSLYGEIILIAFFFPYVRSFQAYRGGIMIGFGLCVFLLVLFNALYVMVFDYPAIEHMAYPYQQLTRAASFGNKAAHLESVFLFIWIIGAVLHFAIYLYLLAYLFSRIFKIHEFEPLILSLAGMILLMAGFPKNIIQQNILRDWLISSTSFMFLLLPIVLWGLHLWKGRTS